MGPRFRVQPELDENFMTKLTSNLDMFTYRLRWSHLSNLTKKDVHVPFARNTVTLPPKMSFEDESNLAAMKTEIIQVTEKEVLKTKKSDQYKNSKKITRKLSLS